MDFIKFLQREVSDSRAVIDSEHNPSMVSYYIGQNEFADTLLARIKNNPQLSQTMIKYYLAGVEREIQHIKDYLDSH